MYSYWTYILRCNDGSYYTGVTDDILHRSDQHNAGKNKTAYTFKRRPVTLVYSAEFGDVYEAIRWEKQIKGWSRKKKEALMRGDQHALEFFSKRKGVQEKHLCHGEVRSHEPYKGSLVAPLCGAPRDDRDAIHGRF